MTTMIAWLVQRQGTDNAVYLASDSRITWAGAQTRWDAGRKLFICRGSADVFGYTGDVLFPLLVLGQISDLSDHGLLFNARSKAEKRHSAVFAALQASHARRHQVPDAGFEIVHIARDGKGRHATFKGWLIRFAGASGKWEDMPMQLDPDQPLAFGSGAANLARKIARRLSGGEADKSRIIFSSFCEGLDNGLDARSGGVPQLVGLFSSGPARAFGLVVNGERFLHGLPTGPIHERRIQWRDCSFSSVEGETLRLKKLVRKQNSARTRIALRKARGDIS